MGISNEEFQDTLKNILQDDDQAKQAMDGILKMMNMFSNPDGKAPTDEDSMKDAQNLFANILGNPNTAQPDTIPKTNETPNEAPK